MTTEDILEQDRAKLAQINDAIASLEQDKRKKSQILLNAFIELREKILIGIESNETALYLEQTINN